ncbi:AAA family ATPase [Corynebacterium sp. zg-331]|uniref:AAA family ATPase n=1 Tax=unclassified Corynebacterium TaxID=2624378 RepID=UPI00128B8828|nr:MULTISPECIES: AAA family ATPase [unclassified Corynebacterium]MBC3186187.1 AAA family ATPase [Corynebacterium sp. zg-331]MPV52675.1 AAA family ATPase [Corynebacterium sp. zg331]
MGFLRAARIDMPLSHIHEDYVARLPAVRHLAQHPLDLSAPITVLTGENGAGKSTLIEAIAIGMGFHPQGGTRNLAVRGADDASCLHKYLTLVRSQNPSDGYFLRGETHFRVALAYGNEAPGDQHLNRMSHGESLMQIIRHRFHGGGLFILDEPEAGLSILRQLELLGHIARMAAQSAQFLIATHSPILMAIPGSTLMEIGASGITPVDFHRAEAVQAAREFVDDPEGTARYLVEGDHA